MSVILKIGACGGILPPVLFGVAYDDDNCVGLHGSLKVFHSNQFVNKGKGPGKAKVADVILTTSPTKC